MSLKMASDLSTVLRRLSPAQVRHFACDCAEHVLPYFEELMPEDRRPRSLIDVARRYATGRATTEELADACKHREGPEWDAAFRLEDSGKTCHREDAAPSAAVAATNLGWRPAGLVGRAAARTGGIHG